MSVIYVENLWKRFGSTLALRGVDWLVDSSGLYLVLGPNGSGKTTLLKIICGLLKPSKGVVRVFNRDPWRSTSVLRRLSAYFEDIRMPWWISGIELAKFIAQRMEIPWSKVRELAHDFGVDEYWRRCIRGYSMGMKKRLALVLTLSRDADIYILDEPFTLLDREGVAKLSNYIERLSRSAVVIVASHVMVKVLQRARDAIVLINGIKVADTRLGKGVVKRVRCSFSNVDEQLQALKMLLTLGSSPITITGNTVEFEGSKPTGWSCVEYVDFEAMYMRALGLSRDQR